MKLQIDLKCIFVIRKLRILEKIQMAELFSATAKRVKYELPAEDPCSAFHPLTTTDTDRGYWQGDLSNFLHQLVFLLTPHNLLSDILYVRVL